MLRTNLILAILMLTFPMLASNKPDSTSIGSEANNPLTIYSSDSTVINKNLIDRFNSTMYSEDNLSFNKLLEITSFKEAKLINDAQNSKMHNISSTDKTRNFLATPKNKELPERKSALVSGTVPE